MSTEELPAEVQLGTAYATGVLTSPCSWKSLGRATATPNTPSKGTSISWENYPTSAALGANWGPAREKGRLQLNLCTTQQG